MERARIVLVDDDRQALEAFKEKFGKEYEVHVFDSAEGLLGSIDALGPIDVLISDEIMPGKQGHQLLEEMKRLRPSTQRIITTAYTVEDAILTCFRNENARSFLKKPWNESYIRKTIEDSLAVKYDMEKFNRELEHKIVLWKTRVIEGRYEHIGRILEVVGYQGGRGAVSAYRTICRMIGIKSHVDWTDATMFDESQEHDMLVKMMERLNNLKKPGRRFEDTDIGHLITSFNDLGIDCLGGHGVVPGKLVSLIYCACQLVQSCRMDESKVSYESDSGGLGIRLGLWSDGGFGYGLENPLCGSDDDVVQRNVWLLHLIAECIDNAGVVTFKESSEMVDGNILFHLSGATPTPIA